MDTNVVSEAVKRRPHPKVVAFLRHLKVGEAYLSALTLGELVQGWPGPRKPEGPSSADGSRG